MGRGRAGGWAGKAVVVTGASAGIGAAAAARFSAAGASTVLLARGAERLEAARRGLGEAAEREGRTMSVRCDVSDARAAGDACRAALERFGKVDVLVNNAGFAVYGRVADLSVSEIGSQMGTNYMGMVHCTKALLPSMLERGEGHIVNVASLAASAGLPGLAAYCASKHAMLGFSEGLKHELRGTGVGVTVVSPIMVRTGFFDHPSFRATPWGRAGKGRRPRLMPSLGPDAVAAAVLRAARSPRLEIAVPAAARGAVWAKQTFPYLVGPALAASFRVRRD